MPRGLKPNIYWERRYNTKLDSELGVVLWDVIPVALQQRVLVRVGSSSAGDRRCAALLTVFAGNGVVACGASHGRELMLWEPRKSFQDPSLDSVFAQIASRDGSLCGSQFECVVRAPEGLLTVERAVWIPPAGGNPGTLSREPAPFSGMQVREQGPVREYHCNAGRGDEGFEQFVFSVELLPGA